MGGHLLEVQYREIYTLLNFSYNGFSLDTNRSSTRQNSATVTTVPSTVAAVQSVSNNVVSPVMSAHVVPSTVTVSTSVVSSFVTCAGTPVSSSVATVVSPTKPPMPQLQLQYLEIKVNIREVSHFSGLKSPHGPNEDK